MRRFVLFIFFALANVNFIYSQSITVTSPNGGEELLINSSQEIEWVSDGIQNVKIEYSLNNGLDWEPITASFPAFTESYNWILPDINSEQVIIKISDTSNNLVIDSSDSIFSIVNLLSQKQNITSITDSVTLSPNSPTWTLTLTSPNPGTNGGVVWNAGENPTITWTSSEISNIDIEFSINGGRDWNNIVTSLAAASGSYSSWTVPGTPTTELVIRIKESGGGISHQNPKYVFIKSPKFNSGDVVKILPLGNSITFDSFRAEFRFAQDRISYRYKLWDSLRTNNYNIDFIGHKSGGYYQFPDPQNNGIPGIADDQLFTFLNSGYDPVSHIQVTPSNYLNVYTPNIVLLHIGSNGVEQVGGTRPTDIEDILNLIDTKSADIWVVLAMIIDWAPNEANVTTFNNNVRSMAQARINSGDKILIVDMQNDAGLIYLKDVVAPHDTGDMYDGVHPNDSGKKKMADLWFKALKLILPNSTTSAPNITSISDTSAYLGLPYRYDVNASGVGAPNYSLTTSPAGMSINLKTGIINWVPTSVGTFPVSVKAKNSTDSTFQNFNITVLPQPTLTNNIISYWKLDETGSPSSVKDLPGVNDAYPISAPATTTGIVKGALNFNGSNKLDVPDDSSLYFYPSESFSIEMWVKTTQSGSGEQIFLGKNGGYTKFTLGINSSDQTKFEIEDSTGVITNVLGPAINDGNWHHVVGVLEREIDTLKIYVDGIRYRTYKDFEQSGFLSYDPLTMGYFEYTKFFNGFLDEIAIYNRALTWDEVKDHYDRGANYGKGYFDQFVIVKTKIFLEGPYIADGDTMSTALKTNNYIPLTSPYSQDPRTVDSIPTGVVDWALIELRSSATGGDTIGYKSAFLKSNGMIVGDNGTTEQIIFDVPPANYYIVARHRNHLGVMSKSPVSLDDNSSVPFTYDFTTSDTSFYGTGGAKELESGVWGMWAGDANGDGQVNAVDRNATWNLRNQTGYLIQDVDEDGQVNAADRNITWNNRNLISKIP